MLARGLHPRYADSPLSPRLHTHGAVPHGCKIGMIVHILPRRRKLAQCLGMDKLVGI